MSTFCLTQKDLLELKFWLTGAVMAEAEDRARRYLKAFGYAGAELCSVLEIGTGPAFGLLPFLKASRKVGCDPLYPAFEAWGILADNSRIERVSKYFDQWVPSPSETFDAIFTTDALDHGDMGFDMVSKMAAMLRPGGSLAIHVHLRPPALLNLIHDHALTVEQLDARLQNTDLVQITRRISERDLDGWECPTLIGVWQKPR